MVFFSLSCVCIISHNASSTGPAISFELVLPREKLTRAEPSLLSAVRVSCLVLSEKRVAMVTYGIIIISRFTRRVSYYLFLNTSQADDGLW